ncbi:NAD(P)-dependent oxidoreductase [Archangium lansingense]|uniref:NAD(P)-dependent oxidoreductase n=1 Tax=Archangium lansingense TaxID=2995310 RepID=A0ABT4AMP8_9BACT|nr:NAD(P)-dependent oxidoreductase [Archangium lansinium]MCY1082966.1 NAD(P)-dependent oxidoreductase [Archangium lansinium]
MKIALYGATGTIGRRIAQEALSRGHQVTAIARNPEGFELKHQNLKVVAGDANEPASVAQVAAGHDAVVTAIGPKQGEATEVLTGIAKSLVTGTQRAGVRRLLVVGGAGGLEAAPGLRVVDTPSFPAAWKSIALAHIAAYDVFRQADLDWTFFAPPALIQPGERTGKYRTGTDQLLTDAKGNSAISAEDYSVALIDELEKPKFLRRRFTAAY